MHSLIELLSPELFGSKQLKFTDRVAKHTDELLTDDPSFAVLLNELSEHPALAGLLGAQAEPTFLEKSPIRPFSNVNNPDDQPTKKSASKSESLRHSDRASFRQPQAPALIPALDTARLRTDISQAPHKPAQSVQSQPKVSQHTKLSPELGRAQRTPETWADTVIKELPTKPTFLPKQQSSEPLPTLTVNTPLVTQAVSASSVPIPTAVMPQPLNSPLQAEVPVALNHPQWGEKVAQNLIQFSQQAGSGTHSAQLRLDPPHLGPVHIHLQVDEGLVTAQFFSPHAQVRQSIEQALPQLFEQFNQAGISLGQTHVGDEQHQSFATHQFEQGFTQQPPQSKESADATDIETSTEQPTQGSIRHTNHIINTFA